jgi:hypothetical protein
MKRNKLRDGTKRIRQQTMRPRRKGEINQLRTREDNTRQHKARTRQDKAPPHYENKQMPKEASGEAGREKR